MFDDIVQPVDVTPEDGFFTPVTFIVNFDLAGISAYLVIVTTLIFVSKVIFSTDAAVRLVEKSGVGTLVTKL